MNMRKRIDALCRDEERIHLDGFVVSVTNGGRNSWRDKDFVYHLSIEVYRADGKAGVSMTISGTPAEIVQYLERFEPVPSDLFQMALETEGQNGMV